MATISSIKEDMIEQFLQCSICLEPFKNPRSLPCNHHFCSDCLCNLVRGKQIFLCPICNKQIKVPVNGGLGFLVAFHTIALQDYIKTLGPNRQPIPCFNGNDEIQHDNATVKCLGCNVYYCNNCNTAHKRAAVAKDHEAIPLSDLTQEHFTKSVQKQVSFCPIHSTCLVSFFCKNAGCQVPVCQRCCITKHRLHECIDIEEEADKCRENNSKILRKDFEDAKISLEKRKGEIRNELQKSNTEFNTNKKLIHGQHLRMLAKLEEKKESLVENARLHKEQQEEEYEQQLIQIDNKLASLEASKSILENISNFSPDDVIVMQENEFQQKADSALEETTLPDLWMQKREAKSSEEFVVDMKMVFDTKSHKIIKCLGHCVTGIALLSEYLVVWHWTSNDTPTDFFVECKNTRKSRLLKEKLERVCPQAYRMVSMERDGKETLLVSEAKRTSLDFIKILEINENKYKIIRSGEIHPGALAVGRQNDQIFIDHGQPLAIRQLIGGDIRTLIENKAENNVLGNPAHICVNINGDIIVSDCKKGSLIILDGKGSVRTTYECFTAGNSNNPLDVCTDETGNIYVCDFLGHCIHQFDKNGHFLDYKLTKPDGLLNPTAIAYSNGMLIIGQEDGNVKYFKI